MDGIEGVRSFNRTVTRRIGALDERFLGRGRALGASRLLFEVGASGARVGELRARLGLDSGYASRLLRSLEGESLVEVTADPADRRARRVAATDAGLDEIAELDRRAEASARSLLEPLTAPQRQRLVRAMGEVERLLMASATTIEGVDPASDEARWCVARYFEELAERFEEGFDADATAPADDSELVPPAGAFLIARVDGRAIGCGAVKTWALGVADIKRMWVAPEARGSGLGRRLLVALEREALDLGLRTARLETNRALEEALAMYRAAGYAPIEPYSGDPYADFAFERALAD